MVVDDKKSTHRRVYPTFAEGYKLLECIGRGSEGSVWRSLCIPTKKEVAIKIIDLESLPSASIAEMHQQIQAMYSCSNHPHVVRYYTSFVHGTSLWSVMKYLSGGSCSDIMRLCHPFGLDEQAIKIILKDTLKALDYFHSYGRIHRDIKAGNIIISENGYVQVADFGVSGSLLVEQLRTTLCGSPCWMAPEVMLRAWPQGREQSDGYDNAVDIWSLGITALELAKGRPPFSEFAPSRVFSMVVQNPPPVLDDDRDTSATRRKFSNAFKDFVSLCLQKDPSMRPSAAKLLKHKFFRGKKSRDYLVNTVLAGLPSQSERSTMMSVNQTLPVMQPTGSSGGSGWNFDDQEDTLALLAASLESASFLGTSTTSQQSLEDHVSDDGSSCDESFFDEYFGAPTPANTFQGSSYFAEPPATPANTMKQRDFSDEEFDGFPTSHPPATPSNTLQAQDFSKQIFAAFPSDPPPTAPTRTMVAQDIAKGVFAALSDPVPTATPSNTMIAQDFAKQVFAAFPTPSSGIESAPPATPSNTMIAQDFAKQVFAAFPTPSSGIESAPPATPSNTMIAQDFAKQVFAAFPSSDAPPATPANTMVAQDFAKQVFAAFPDSVPTRTPMNTLQARDFAEESFAGLPSILSPAPTPANTMQAADFEDEVFDDFPSLGESVPCSASSTPSLHNSHFLMDEDLSYHSSDSDELDF